ncbi:DUF3040 domain-containing protein [Citricoccus sp. SGAir0253]|uniref:DUF3040 domain-containing protein n=1 Tax=Citricoccus sp. SGAir0253 TaxID=2567881 RepID=UPI0010CCBC84|nr:DUF3040 domain-containing protein [Citricoccus sp. SGAir0253]QCU77830.1 DUF3040 domain-containing protein [Citricoccus sp. SGAir0253]
MPLSDREQKLLEQLEQQLNAEDPQFATSMSEAGTRRFSTSRLVSGAVAAVVGLAVLLWGVSQHAIWLGIIGFVLMAAGVYVGTARTKASPSGRPGGRGGARKNTPFMDGLEQRWEKRRNQDT